MMAQEKNDEMMLPGGEIFICNISEWDRNRNSETMRKKIHTRPNVDNFDVSKKRCTADKRLVKKLQSHQKKK
jgi:hypothetical protein